MIRPRLLILTVLMAVGLFLAVPRAAQAQLPDGPGHDLTVKTCSRCHEVDRIMAQHQDKEGWLAIVNKMQGLGLTATDEDIKQIVEYLAVALPAEKVEKMNINKMTAVEFETNLGVTRPVSRAIVNYRDEKGDFKSLDDLKKIPGVDPAKVDAKKDKLTV